MPIINREDIEKINAIGNEQDVRPYIGYGRGHFDITPLAGRCDVNAFVKNGCAVFTIDTGQGECEGHYMFSKESRGKEAIEFCEHVFSILKKRGIKRVLGKTPKENLLAMKFNKLIGMKKKGEGIVNSPSGDIFRACFYEREL